MDAYFPTMPQSKYYRCEFERYPENVLLWS